MQVKPNFLVLVSFNADTVNYRIVLPKICIMDKNDDNNDQLNYNII